MHNGQSERGTTCSLHYWKQRHANVFFFEINTQESARYITNWVNYQPSSTSFTWTSCRSWRAWFSLRACKENEKFIKTIKEDWTLWKRSWFSVLLLFSCETELPCSLCSLRPSANNRWFPIVHTRTTSVCDVLCIWNVAVIVRLGSISAAPSFLAYPRSGEERGLLSRTAAGNRAYSWAYSFTAVKRLGTLVNTRVI